MKSPIFKTVRAVLTGAFRSTRSAGGGELQRMAARITPKRRSQRSWSRRGMDAFGRSVLVLCAAAALLHFCTPQESAALPQSGALCRIAILHAEDTAGIPAGLLLAIGMTEAGRSGQVWPWTLNRGGRARYFPNFHTAVTVLNRYIQRGHRNVDAGCLQLNMQWAGRGMTAEQLLNPQINAFQAARHLMELRREAGNWPQAVAYYHTRNGTRGRKYVCRVARAFVKIQGSVTQDKCPASALPR